MSDVVNGQLNFSVQATFSGFPGLGVQVLYALEKGDGTNANNFSGGQYEPLQALVRY